MASQAYFSEEFVSEAISVRTNQEWKELNRKVEVDNGMGLKQLEIFYNNFWNIEGKTQKVIENSGYTLEEIEYGINGAYASTGKMDFTNIFFIVAVVLMILSAGYLMIYNIFYISIVNDIRFYGLLKTLGTTGKQIKQLIRRQGDVLCLVGIPLGIILGWLIGNAFVPLTIGSFSEKIEAEFTINPAIFIFSVLFSYATVRISCRKPGKIAAEISPVEAEKDGLCGGIHVLRTGASDDNIYGSKQLFYQ